MSDDGVTQEGGVPPRIILAQTASPMASAPLAAGRASERSAISPIPLPTPKHRSSSEASLTAPAPRRPLHPVDYGNPTAQPHNSVNLRQCNQCRQCLWNQVAKHSMPRRAAPPSGEPRL